MKHLKMLDLEPIYIDHEKNYKINNLLMSERVSPAGNYRKEIVNSIASKFIDLELQNEKNNKYDRFG